LTSFGQAAFVGIGAYATAWYTAVQGGSPWTGLLLALVLSGLAATILGAATLRLSGHFLPLSTIAWGIAIYFVFGNLDALNRYSGLFRHPADLHRTSLTRRHHRNLLLHLDTARRSSCCFAATCSIHGKAAPSAACAAASPWVESLAIDSFRMRLAIFVLAGVLAGLSGWLYAHMQRFVNPTPFDIRPGIELLFMALVGGAGQIAGAVVGAAIVVLLKNVLQDVLPAVTRYSAQLEVVFFGVLLVIILQKARGGIVPMIRRFLPRPVPIAPVAAAPLARRARPAVTDQGGAADRRATKRFGALAAVNEVSFEVRPGEVLGLIGPNGAGKTTLLNLITGTASRTPGRSCSSATTSPHGAAPIAAKGMARTFQHVKLRPNMTLIDNVLLGTYPRTHSGFLAGALRSTAPRSVRARRSAAAVATRRPRREVRRARRQSAARPAAHARSGARARRRSGGRDPGRAGRRPAALEKETLSDLLRSLRGDGMTIVLVEHDMDFVMNLVDRIVVMDFGAKLAEGLPAEIRADARVQEAYLGGVA
jgi:branched-chain amino acid transport system permease protein